MNVEMKGIDKAFGTNQVLKNAGFFLEDGEIHALMGENGAGKSTLMKILTGVYTKDAGTVLVDGQEVTYKSPQEAEKAGIVFIYQEMNSLFDLTVEENLFMGKEITKGFGICDKKAMRAKAREVMERMGVNIDVGAVMSDLSVGQQQMVEICKALMADAKVLILDEPTRGVDIGAKKEIYSVINDLAAKGVAVIMVSSELPEVLGMSDRIMVVHEGHVTGIIDAEGADQVIDGEEGMVKNETTASGKIGLSVSTQNNPFFVTLVEGAEKAASSYGVEMSVVDAGDDVTKQVSDIEDLVSKGISVLIVNPVDSDAVTGAVEAAKGVKVIAVDRVVNGVEIECQIASDNVLGAELATQYIVEKLGEGIKVAELEGVPGASAAIDRSAGFHNVADAKLDVVAKQTANFDCAQGMSVMENMLQANGNIQAVFAANDEMALGAVEAIAGAGKDIMVVGFDATDDAIAAIKEGRMAATIAQQPDLIGKTAVENAHKLISGKGIPASIPVEVTLVTADNAN